MLVSLLPFALILFLLCMFLVDTLQVLLRAISAIMSAPVLGAHLGSIFMLVNRATAALALLTIGYLVDTSIPGPHLLTIYAGASLIIAVCHLPLLRRGPLLNLTLVAFRHVYGKTCEPQAIQAARDIHRERVEYKLSTAVAGVTALGFLGLLAPSLLASSYLDYRATLMQTGFILNSIASIVSVLQVERRIAMVMDNGTPQQINALYSSYIVSRAIGYLAAMLAFLLPLVTGSAARWIPH
jgi:hypothetical protein